MIFRTATHSWQVRPPPLTQYMETSFVYKHSPAAAMHMVAVLAGGDDTVDEVYSSYSVGGINCDSMSRCHSDSPPDPPEPSVEKSSPSVAEDLGDKE